MKNAHNSLSLLVFLCAAASACTADQNGGELPDSPEATGETSQAVVTDVAKSIVGLVGKCIDVDYTTTTASGNHRAVLKQCNGTASQAWTFLANGQVKNSSSGKCLNVEGGATANNTAVVEYTCSASPYSNERWTYQQYTSGAAAGTAQIIGFGSGRCLNVPAANRADGTELIIYDCVGVANDRWYSAKGTYKTIKVGGVRLGNDDGSNRASMILDQFAATLADANAVYMRAGILFQVNGWYTINSTNLNTITASGATTAQDTEARALATSSPHSGEITVLLSSASTGGFSGYSGSAGDYVLMPGAAIDSGTFIHELGHYFSLAHTMYDSLYPDPNTEDANTKVYNSLNYWGFNADAALNADGLGDTPPDPGPWVFERRYAMATNLPGAWHSCEGKDAGDKTDKIDITIPGTSTVKMTLEPDRHNMMGYFNCTAANQRSVSPMQMAKMRSVLTQPGRSQL